MHKNRAGALRPRHDLIICVFVSTPTIDREPKIKCGRLCEKPAAFLFKQENHRQCRWLQKGFAGKRNDFRNKTFGNL